MNKEICPICSGKVVGGCRCLRGDKYCENGHSWHTCFIHKKTVLSESNHTLPYDKCTCLDSISDVTKSIHQYIEAPKKEAFFNPDSIFIGGGISGCEDWQKVFIGEFDGFTTPVTLVNPRREDFDISKIEESEKQIAWEYEMLRKVKHVVFWFSKETLCPITLLELGATLERWKYSNHAQAIYVGCHPEYKRVFDVKIQCKMSNYHFVIQDNVKDLAKVVKDTVSFFNGKSVDK